MTNKRKGGHKDRQSFEPISKDTNKSRIHQEIKGLLKSGDNLNSINPNRLTRQEQRLYEMFSRGGRYTVADIVRELGQCDPRGHISRMRRKGIGIADIRVTHSGGASYKLYWLAEE